MLTSELIAEAQDLLRLYGDLPVSIGADDETEAADRLRVQNGPRSLVVATDAKNAFWGDSCDCSTCVAGTPCDEEVLRVLTEWQTGDLAAAADYEKAEPLVDALEKRVAEARKVREG